METNNLLRNKAEYLVALVSEFGKKFQLTNVQSYRYLRGYGGISFALKHYDIVHTLSFSEVLEALRDYCLKRGGNIK